LAAYQLKLKLFGFFWPWPGCSRV